MSVVLRVCSCCGGGSAQCRAISDALVFRCRRCGFMWLEEVPDTGKESA